MKKPDHKHKTGKDFGPKKTTDRKFDPKSENKFDSKKDKKFGSKFDSKKSFKEEKKPSFFDQAFVDPDKIRRQKEREEERGSSEEIIFSKSIDDVPNPKYSGIHSDKKEDYTPKERQKYREKFPHLADKNRKPFSRKDEDNPERNVGGKKFERNERKPFGDKPLRREKNGESSDRPDKKFDRKRNDAQGGRFEDKAKRFDAGEKSFPKKGRNFESRNDRDFKPREPRTDKDRPEKVPYDSPHFKQKFTPFSEDNKAYTHQLSGKSKHKFDGKDKKLEAQLKADHESDKMPLNKYIARSGVCSRRDAVELIKAGKVKVNDSVVDEPGYKVQEHDIVRLDGKKLHIKEEFVYILLNKPKGYITTLDDPKGRRIITELYEQDIKERIFPVGRLDRNTTGLLLITNDGDLSNKLAHPKYQIRKIYQVELDKPVTGPHMQQILDGLELEDGTAQVDHITYLQSKDEIGIEIHSGKNRIVRRIFEHLGYSVDKLDRVLYAGLTKKNLPKGQWRMLTRQEVINLKHLNKGR